MTPFKQLRRRPLAIVVDACIVINSYTLASLVLFARWAPLEYYNQLLLFLPVAVIVHCAINYRLGLYRIVGRYAGLNQAVKLSLSSLIAFPILIITGFLSFPSSLTHAIAMVPIGIGITFVLMSGVRFYPRVFYERSLKGLKPNLHMLIVGAGSAGEMIIRSIQKEKHRTMDVVGLVDDDPALHGMEIHGVPILGPTERIPELVTEKDVDEILIAIPSAGLDQFQRIWGICSRTAAPTKTLRPLQSMHLGKVGVSQIRDIEIEDVLGRQPVLTDYGQISRFISGKTVLITGAGGSIGSELTMQISHHNPASIILVDRDESALYELHEKLTQKLFLNHELYVADIRSHDMLEKMFMERRPELVFHAAAYKHVPLMELQPDEAVINNVNGTYNLATTAGFYGAECFINISTDKAVEPANIMGATKYLGEWLTCEMNSLYPETRYCSVRFGNVLGSRGSVVPIFRKQIRRGGPITVTHPEMTRYFMLISEAVDLVLQAAAFSDGNRGVYVLEMGQPVRIVDLAKRMIEFMRPESPVDIDFIGLRPGEKLHEQLIDKFESRAATDHPMIYHIGDSPWEDRSLLERLPNLLNLAHSRDAKAIVRLIDEWIDSYSPFDMRRVGSTEPAERHISGLNPRSGESADEAGAPSYQW